MLLLADGGRCPRRVGHYGHSPVGDRLCYAVGLCMMQMLVVHAGLTGPLVPTGNTKLMQASKGKRHCLIN